MENKLCPAGKIECETLDWQPVCNGVTITPDAKSCIRPSRQQPIVKRFIVPCNKCGKQHESPTPDCPYYNPHQPIAGEIKNTRWCDEAGMECDDFESGVCNVHCHQCGKISPFRTDRKKIWNAAVDECMKAINELETVRYNFYRDVYGDAILKKDLITALEAAKMKEGE